jgi:MFS family permease
MQTVAVGWQVYDITHDPLDLGLIGLSQFLPFIILILPAGHAADHYDRRKILTSCYLLNMSSALGLLAFSVLGIHAAGPIFAVMTLLGVTRAFAMPSAQALVPNLVRPELFAKATAVNSTVFQVCTIVGPTLGGVLYLAGPGAVFGTVATLLGISTLLMTRVRIGGRSASAAPAVSLRSLLSDARNQRCSAPFRSTCSPCCSAALRRCCRSMHGTSCTRLPSGSACCALRRASEPPRARWS